MKMIQCCLTDFGNSCESPKCTKTAILESRRAHSEERRNSENQRKNINFGGNLIVFSVQIRRVIAKAGLEKRNPVEVEVTNNSLFPPNSEVLVTLY